MLHRFFRLIVVLLCSSHPASAIPPTTEAEPTIDRPVIDGKLDEPAWNRARPATGFRQHDPDEGQPATERTEVRVLQDSENLYVSFRCFDTEPRRIQHTTMKRDAAFHADDTVFLVLDPFGRERDGFLFMANPNGTLRDGKISTSPTSPDMNWDALWDADAKINDQGWTAEFAIPFRSLNFDPDLTEWGINFGRFIPRKQESSRWTAASRNRDIDGLEDAGTLTGLRNPEAGLGLDLLPYTAVAWNEENDDLEFDAGFDLRYQVTPNMTATLTFNTDFAETEVDSRRVNLTRFPLFFPEKRDFFLEGAEFFEVITGSRPNFRPFHSRTIGLSSGGEKMDLLGGGKVTGRMGKLGVGILGVGLDGLDNLSQDEAFAGRFTYDVLKESHVGLIATHGDPRGPTNNSLLGIDFNFKDSHFIGDNVMLARAWIMGTEDNGRTEEAFGSQIRYVNDPFAFVLEGEQVDPRFRPAMGFKLRDGRRARGFIRFRFHSDEGWIQWHQLAVDAQLFTTIDGDTESGWTEPVQYSLQSRRGDNLFITPLFKREVLFEDFEIRPGITVPVGDYHEQGVRLSLNTTQTDPVSFGLQGELGDFFNGDRIKLVPSLTWRPSDLFTFDLGGSYNDVQLPGGAFETLIASAGFLITPSPRFSLNTLGQWDNDSNQLGINSRLRWIIKPGQDLFVVVNQGLDVEDNSLRSTQTETIAKVGMTLRF